MSRRKRRDEDVGIGGPAKECTKVGQVPVPAGQQQVHRCSRDNRRSRFRSSTEPLASRWSPRFEEPTDDHEVVMRKVFVGHDWAEAHHDVYVQNAEGRRLGKARLAKGFGGAGPFPRTGGALGRGPGLVGLLSHDLSLAKGESELQEWTFLTNCAKVARQITDNL